MFADMNIISKNSFMLLRFLGRHYREKFYVREIARVLDMGLGTASETLGRLTDAGLLHREKRGCLVMYQAAMESTLLREMKICATLIELNPLILQLNGIVTRVILFGSTATGEDTHESDIDLFVETMDTSRVDEVVTVRQATLERKISPIIITPGEFRSLKTTDPALHTRILSGKLLIEELR